MDDLEEPTKGDLAVMLEEEREARKAAVHSRDVMVDFIDDVTTLCETYVAAVAQHAVAHAKADEIRHQLAGQAYKARAELRHRVNAARAAAFLAPLPQDFLLTVEEVLGVEWGTEPG